MNVGINSAEGSFQSMNFADYTYKFLKKEASKPDKVKLL